MKLKKSKFLALSLAAMFVLSGCSGGEKPAATTGGSSSDISLEQVNEFLNTTAGLGPNGIANVVSVVPHAHIDGPKNETPFYAFVNWKYKARDYIKYQVSYLSCTCREASVNMWQTMYVELTLPESQKIEDAKVKYVSFGADAAGTYTGGHWGDSDPIPSGQTYEMFETEYLPYFTGKDSAFISTLSTIDDIDLADYQAGDGRTAYDVDTFSGASVSANNIIRILNSMMDYHGTDEFFTK